MRTTFLARIFLLELICLGVSAAPVAAIEGTPVWFPSVVSTPVTDTFVSSPSLSFDHFGVPSVSWSRVSTIVGNANTVFRSELLGSGLWAHRPVASGIGVGLSTSLSFDRAERPTVAWLDSTGEIRADFNDGQTVGIVGANGNPTIGSLSLSHDLAGNLRGVYAGAAAGTLNGIGFDGVSFSNTTLATLSGVDEIIDVQLATDYAGLRHIVARAGIPGGGEGVIIASEPSFPAAWPSAVLATADDIGGVAVATNPVNGRVAVAYTTRDTAGGTSSLFFAEFNGFALETTEVLLSSTTVFEDISLAFDLSDGRPAIAFEENMLGGDDRLRLAFLDGADQWQTSLIDDSIALDAPTGNRKPSLAFDDFGTSFPAVAFVDADGTLMVSFDPPITPEPVTAALLMSTLVLFRRRR